MPVFETITFPFGKVQRRHAPVTSATLLALPEARRPKPVLACGTCPAGKWYHDEGETLACHCRARHYMSWKTGQKAMALCDDREDALAEREPGDDES